MAEDKKTKVKKSPKSIKIDNPEQVEKMTNQLAKQITQINKKRKRKGVSKYLPFNVNPFVLATVVLLISFFSFNLIFASSSSLPSRSLTELISGLERNQYSQLIINNDGTVQAREKEFSVLLPVIEDGTFENTNVDIQNNNVVVPDVEALELKESSIEDVRELFRKPDFVSSLRSQFGNQEERITEVVLFDSRSIFITPDGFDNYVVQNFGILELDEFLKNESIDEESYQFEIKNLRIFAEGLNGESLKERFDDDQYAQIYRFDDILIAQYRPELVETYSIDWIPIISSFTDLLQSEGFSLSGNVQNFEIIPANIPQGITFDTILTLLTIGAFIFIGFVIFRSAQASGMGIMQFGQSKAKVFFGQKSETSFDDVAGIDEAREELNEIVDFLKNPNKYRKLGARIPKGILMVGAPGTGKTLLARAIAGEAGVPFFHTSGSEFEEMLVGAGASRVRDLFAKAKKASPALIFIDEIDAVARKRGTRIQSGSTEQTLNQILVEMDGFEKNTNVIVIAATNRPDVLDRAILRPGRFDRQVRIEVPDKDGRLQILQIHTKNKPLDEDVDLERVAKRTVGFTGADLENIMNESAIIAAKDSRKTITDNDIDEAVSKVVLGPAKRSRKRTEEELKLVAYHEAGHALIAKLTKGATPVDRISIVSRGRSGGVTMFLPEKDVNIISKNKLLADIRVGLGGRVAEELALDDISTGASGDIQQVTQTARRMIQRFGMSKDLGMVQYGQSMDSEYLGYAYGDSKDFSEDTAERIDNEVREIISNEYGEAVKLMKANMDKLDKIAEMLIEKEVLDKAEFNKIFDN